MGKEKVSKDRNMRFRPCIDIHNGKVKQIVGGSLRDAGDAARENFVSERDAAWYAAKYAQDGLRGGHVILLNPASSDYYEETRRQALEALGVCPGSLQAGGGITPENAAAFLDAGASHVIVTSYVFRDGRLDEAALERMLREVGRERLVLDLSCRQISESEASGAAPGAGPYRGEERADSDGEQYRIVTDRWQKNTQMLLSPQLLTELSGSCDEFLVHAVDAEGKSKGPQRGVLRILAAYAASGSVGSKPSSEAFREARPVTYAGGIASMEDVAKVRTEGRGRVDYTVGSALDLFGGSLPYRSLFV